MKYSVLTSAMCLSLLVACGESNSSTANGDAESSKSVTKGSIDIVVSGETVELNSSGDTSSSQCQLSFTVKNNSKENLKSLIVNFDVLNLSDGAVVKSGSQMVITSTIKSGEAGAPWGAHTFDDVRCDGIKLRFPPQPSYQCTTDTKKVNCAAFTYSGGDAIAVEAGQ